MAKERFDPLEKGKDLGIIDGYMERYRRAGDYLDPRHGQPTLDAACGTGYGTVQLSYASSSVVGVDVSQQTIGTCQTAHEKARRVRYECRDLETWDIPAEYGSVVSLDTIEHLRDPERFVKRAKRHASVVVLAWPLRLNSNPFHISQIAVDDVVRWMSDWRKLGLAYEGGEKADYVFSAWGRG